MRRIVVTNNLTLDGVMQAPGRADEDTRGGFRHGGWARAYNDAVKGQAMAKGMAQGGELLFGRRTYDDFFKVWPGRQDNPFTAVLDNTVKYVASTTLKEPLPWKNSVLLSGDAPANVSRLKQTTGKDLVILGSGDLVRSLMSQNLIDEYVLMIHPLVLGEGIRMFPNGGVFATLKLVKSVPTTAGVIIATYQTTT
jgi:dihydrofolate reductase